MGDDSRNCACLARQLPSLWNTLPSTINTASSLASFEIELKKTRDRGGWKRLSDEVVKKLRAAPHP